MEMDVCFLHEILFRYYDDFFYRHCEREETICGNVLNDLLKQKRFIYISQIASKMLCTKTKSIFSQ